MLRLGSRRPRKWRTTCGFRFFGGQVSMKLQTLTVRQLVVVNLDPGVNGS